MMMSFEQVLNANPGSKHSMTDADNTSTADDTAAEESPQPAESDADAKTKSTKAEPREKAAAKPPPARTGAPPPDGHWWWGTGRRKTAVARVRLRPGDGKFMVNRRPYDKYFTEDRDHKDLLNVLEKTNTVGGLEIHVNVNGGGYTGQAGAIVLGLGRAIRRYDETLEPILRSNGFLSRDPRKVERKKYGQPGARKRFQFSKR